MRPTFILLSFPGSFHMLNFWDSLASEDVQKVKSFWADELNCLYPSSWFSFEFVLVLSRAFCKLGGRQVQLLDDVHIKVHPQLTLTLPPLSGCCSSSYGQRGQRRGRLHGARRLCPSLRDPAIVQGDRPRSTAWFLFYVVARPRTS